MLYPLHTIRKILLREKNDRGRTTQMTPPRPHVFGDDCRKISWNATARTGELHVQGRPIEKTLQVATIVDTSASMSIGRRRPLSEAAEEARGFWQQLAVPAQRYIHLSTADIFETLESPLNQIPRDAALLVVTDMHAPASNKCAQHADARRDQTLRTLAFRYRCTVLVASDPWCDGIPLRGFHRIRDIETHRSQVLFFSALQRERYKRAIQERQRVFTSAFLGAGWRTGPLTEEDAVAGLVEAFRRG